MNILSSIIFHFILQFHNMQVQDEVKIIEAQKLNFFPIFHKCRGRGWIRLDYLRVQRPYIGRKNCYSIPFPDNEINVILASQVYPGSISCIG